jgi:putative oxygen-independent coproporphyrinogen III oxidase
MKMKRKLELYIHIPFCIQKCNYCDFLSFSTNESERTQYVQALLKQIENQKVVAKEYIVTTIFIGGGTPSIIETMYLELIFTKLHEVFYICSDAEISIEMNPATATREKLQSYRDMGINRLSIGVQSTNETELKHLGRVHTYQDFKETFRQAREVGFANINIDLISAIPEQSVFSWQDSLRKVIKLQPEHISVYSLIIEEGTPFFEWYENTNTISNVPSLPKEEEMLQMDEVTAKEFGKSDYTRYEISNYAKKGYECKHNLGYWEREEYLGLGLGASSYIRGERLKNTMSMEEYLLDSQMLESKNVLTTREKMEEFFFLGLRKIQGISEMAFLNEFESTIDDIYESEISDLQEKGLLKRRNSRVYLTKRGLEVGNYVFEQFIQI